MGQTYRMGELGTNIHGSDEIAVSVLCTAFNHGKYIRDALEGFISQKTNFRFEVLVHDDASTDNTPEIIREYAAKYPEIIVPILQTENQYSKEVDVDAEFLLPKARGKYIALCEGDDFWSDENKLHLQCDALEQHPECSICCHYTKWIEQTTGAVGGYYPGKRYGIKNGIVDENVQMDISLNDLFHITSMLIRKTEYEDYIYNMPDFAKKMSGSDVSLNLYLTKHGKMYFINREMSVYRRGTEGSWTQRIRRNPEKAAEHFRTHVAALEACKPFFEGKYETLLNRCICACEFLIAEQTGDYQELKKDILNVYRSGGLKWVLKLYICAAGPAGVKFWSRLQKN